MKGLKFRLILLCVGMISVFATVTSLLYIIAASSQKASKMAAFESHARALGDALAAQFYERYGDVQAFGRNTVFYGKDVALMTTTLSEYASDYGIYDLIIFTDMKGNVIATNDKSPSGKPINLDDIKGKNFSDAPWFKNVIDGKTTDDAAKGFKGTYFESAHMDSLVKSALGTDGYGTIFSALVTDASGKPVGVMSNHANWSWAENEMLNLHNKFVLSGFADTDILLVDKTGVVISSVDPDSVKKDGVITNDFSNMVLKYNPLTSGDEGIKRALAGQFGNMLAMDPHEKREHVYGYGTIDSKKWVSSNGWGVVVKAEKNTAFASINNATKIFFGVGGIIYAICCLVGYWFASRLASNLVKISEGVTEAAQTVSNASTELAAASQSVSSGATEAAASLEETVASIEELTSMVRLNSDNAAQAAALAQGSSKTAAEGENEVRSLITSITEISNSSQKIEDIINVIDDIAFQTNLLALNAAVEAARAGEQGKGFAVVAEAVRNLAQRSATAAKEISGLIKDNVSKIETGTKQADRSGAVLKEILTSVRKVADISNEISSASQEQSTGLAQISKAMNELDQATQRNASTSEHVASSSDEMSNQATGLQSVVGELNQIIYGRILTTSEMARDKKSNLKATRKIAATTTAMGGPASKKLTIKTKSSDHIKLAVIKTKGTTSPAPTAAQKVVSNSSPSKIAPMRGSKKSQSAEAIIPFGDDEEVKSFDNIQGF